MPRLGSSRLNGTARQRTRRMKPRNTAQPACGSYNVASNSDLLVPRNHSPEESPPTSSSSSSSSAASTRGKESPPPKSRILFRLEVKGATYYQFSNEYRFWVGRVSFLREEYLDLLMFFEAAGSLKREIYLAEKQLNKYKLMAAKAIVDALNFMEEEVVEFPPSKEAVMGLEMAYEEWNKFDNTLLEKVTKGFN